MGKIFLSLAAVITVVGGAFYFYPEAKTSSQSQQQTVPPVYSYRVVKVYPHDPQAFTQGLVYHHGLLYEGTGLRGKSELRRVELATGKILQTHSLNPSHFGEGITLWQDKIIQLTWTSRVGFVYNQDSFQVLEQFTYPTEGWGITSDGEQLIMSDGSDTLYFLDPETLTETGRVKVRDRGTPIVR